MLDPLWSAWIIKVESLSAVSLLHLNCGAAAPPAPDF